MALKFSLVPDALAYIGWSILKNRREVLTAAKEAGYDGIDLPGDLRIGNSSSLPPPHHIPCPRACHPPPRVGADDRSQAEPRHHLDERDVERAPGQALAGETDADLGHGTTR